MPTDVIMPQMGESIFEGTITKWLKKAGDAVEKDEPLFEISTDKVDAEIPAPAAGVLSEIKYGEGETVQINTVVAVISEGGSAGVVPAQPAKSAVAAAKPSPVPEMPAQRPTSEKLAPPRVAQVAGTDVVMPQMGESIFEGTITKWLKKAGDAVRKDEPLFEISTDKVDAEIPAPVAGVLTEIKVAEGETVEINTVVAVIGGAAPLAQPDGMPATPRARTSPAAAQARAEAPPSPAAMPSPSAPATPEPAMSTEPIRSSPLVRRMARENNLDLRRIAGTGSAGRVTKDDVLHYMAQRGTASEQPVPTPNAIPGKPSTVTPAAATLQPGGPAMPEGLQPLSRMRSIIAQRMVESKQISPHAYTIYKIDMTRIVRLRERSRGRFEQQNGIKLTYMPFIAAAAVQALRKFPIVNASMEGNAIRYHRNIHLGIAVALEWGLIVPVIREAEKQGFVELSRAIADLAERARTKKLKPEEASGSTFTLTNSGVFGGEYGTPILNQPESAILAIGGLRKEPVVLTDAEGNDTIAIRSMQHYCLGFDHRTIDGGDAGKFMSVFKDVLESWDRDVV